MKISGMVYNGHSMITLDLANTPEKQIIQTTLEILASGGLVIFPTETTYGAGVDATNQAAVDKLLAYKSRREGKPLSIAVADQNTAAKYVKLNEQAKELYQRFLPGPVTVVSQGRNEAAAGVESEFGTLGVRIPDYPLLLEILKAFGKPMTATSANASGQKRPYQVQDILQNISQKQRELIDLVLDAGQLPKNEPSTVIDTTLSTPTVLRAGLIRADNQPQLVSHSEQETKKIAGTLMLKYWSELKEKGLVFGLSGPLGAGKTIFTKGIAEFLQIEETITSPTYSYLESYQFTRHGIEGQLHHLDLWKVDQAETLERLELSLLLQPKNVVVIEWWQQGQKYLPKLINEKKLPIILVTLKPEEVNSSSSDEQSREIYWQFKNS